MLPFPFQQHKQSTLINLIKNILLRNTPSSILEVAKLWKKKNREKYLNTKKLNNDFVTVEQLEKDLKTIGVKNGDSILVHCSMSKIGYLENGPITIVKAIQNTIGKEGTLLMPAFPAEGRNFDYLEGNKKFDVRKTPSKMGAVTEYFRLLPDVKRSHHPTDSVCALGPLAEYYTSTHKLQLTPYNEHSPFRKLCNKGGKILMLGTTLNGACTNLHTLEDAVDFKYPIYDNKIFDIEIIDEQGDHYFTKTKVHNPMYSAKRNCDALKPIFERENVLKNGKIGEANSMLIDANELLNVMIKYYNQFGVTMYTPYGEKGNLKN